MALNQGLVVNPTKQADGIGSAVLGRQGDQLASDLHGKWYTAALNGRVFLGSSLIAGVIIPVNTTTAPTFTLFNPLGSGINVELISLDIGWPAAAASVVGTILGSLSTQTPSSVTSGGATISSPVGGGGIAQAKLYTAATITAITTHIPLVQVSRLPAETVSASSRRVATILAPPRQAAISCGISSGGCSKSASIAITARPLA